MSTPLTRRNAEDMVLFAYVVSAGSITGGGKMAGMERSSVSRRISSLESRLGVSLLERSTRQLRLTAEGREYYRHCARVVEAAEDAEASARGYRIELQGALKIAASMCEAEKYLSKSFAEFAKLHQKVRIELSLNKTHDSLLSSGADLLLHWGALFDRDLESVHIGEVPESLWASPAYLAQLGGSVSIEALKQADTICLASEDDRPVWQLFDASGVVDVEIFPQFRVDTISGCRDACLSGLGFAKLPDYLCRAAVAGGELTQVLTHYHTIGDSLYAVHSDNHFPGRAAQAFIRFLVRQLQATQPRRPHAGLVLPAVAHSEAP